jgi:hypothetical protein
VASDADEGENEILRVCGQKESNIGVLAAVVVVVVVDDDGEEEEDDDEDEDDDDDEDDVVVVIDVVMVLLDMRLESFQPLFGHVREMVPGWETKPRPSILSFWKQTPVPLSYCAVAHFIFCSQRKAHAG